jgi:hypothetical protein
MKIWDRPVSEMPATNPKLDSLHDKVYGTEQQDHMGGDLV